MEKAVRISKEQEKALIEAIKAYKASYPSLRYVLHFDETEVVVTLGVN